MRDNILPKIMAAPEGHSELFQREIAKYDSLKADITGVLPPPPCPWDVLRACACSISGAGPPP